MGANILGAAMGNCGHTLGAEQGPTYLQKQYPRWNWQSIIEFKGAQRKLAAIPALVDFSNELAAAVSRVVQSKQRFCVIGGDHSCAIGTWSGVAKSLSKPFGLIWIDAHLDSHTPDSSHSKNPHGMPVATLLGHGDDRLTTVAGLKPKLLPAHVVMIGIRSYEPEEQALLTTLGVKIYYMPEVQQRGFGVVLQEAQQYLLQQVDGYGISLDLDGLDPQDCDATGSKVAGGIRLQDALSAFAALDKSTLVGIEIAEFNPHLGHADITATAIAQMVKYLQTDGN